MKDFEKCSILKDVITTASNETTDNRILTTCRDTIKTPDDLVEFMTKATSEKDWNDRCDKIKEAFGGDYPEFWYTSIVLSGVLLATKSRW
jgi:hypothetical protein